MRFYQVRKTTTTLGGSPYTKSWFYQVWDNAFKKHHELITSALGSGMREKSNKSQENYLYAEYFNDRTGTTVEIEVYTREFED